MLNKLANFIFSGFKKKNPERFIMQISNYPVQPSFGIRIYNKNNALTEITEVAVKRGMLPTLDGILNNLSQIKGDNLVISHGIHKPTGVIFSITNNVQDCATPADASLKALFELLDKDNPKLMRLLGKRISRFVRKEDIIRKYSVK